MYIYDVKLAVGNVYLYKKLVIDCKQHRTVVVVRQDQYHIHAVPSPQP